MTPDEVTAAVGRLEQAVANAYECPDFVATQIISHTGRSEWWLYEYDLGRPRQLKAENVRARYAVKRLVGVYPNRREAMRHAT